MNKVGIKIDLYQVLIEQLGITEPWVLKAVRSLRYQSNPYLERRLTTFLNQYATQFQQTLDVPYLLPSSQAKLTGELSLGHVIGKPNVVSRLPIAPMNMHTLITGSAGSGKTVLTLTLCEQALKYGLKGIRITDPKAYEFTALAQKYPQILLLHVKELAFNIFTPPPNVTYEEWFSLIVNHFALCFNFWQGGEAMLLDAIYTLHKKGEVTLSKLQRYLENKKGISQKDYMVKSTLLSRLNMLQHEIGTQVEKDTDLLEALSELPYILIVEGLLAETESWLHEYLLLWDFHYRKHNPQKQFLTLRVYDECQHRIFNNQKEKTNQFGTATLISKIVDESRALGLGIVAISQEPSTLLKSLLNNSHTKFCLHLGSGQEIRVASEAMGLTREQTKNLHYLETGEAIVRTGTGYLDPYPVKINMFQADKALSDEDFIQFQMILKEKLFEKTVFNATQTVFTSDSTEPESEPAKKPSEEPEHAKKDEHKAKPSPKPKKPTKKKTDIDSLLAIWLNLPVPFLTQKQIMKKADIKSGSKQTQLKNNAVRDGFIVTHKIQVGRTYSLIWEPTDKAYEKVGVNRPSFASKGGYLHQFIAHHVTLWAKKRDYNAHIEYYLDNKKAVDVSVDDGEAMAFYEIVVSKPYEKELNNIEKDLATQLIPKELIFLVTDNKVRKEFEAVICDAEIPENHRSLISVKLAGDFIVS